jgi:hypothetical protein
MPLPNFLILGSAKCGTTALHHYLRQHPQVYMPSHKESNFFMFEGEGFRFNGPLDFEFEVTTLEAYEKRFHPEPEEVAIGEASPWYLYSPRAAENIHHRIPEAKLIAVLRNPADRAFSSYLHVVREGRENLSFEEGLLAEEERIARGWEFIWHYRRAGFYTAQIERYLGLFPRERMRIYLYDDLLEDPARLMKDIYEFLGVDAEYAVDTSTRYNATGVPKNRLLGKLLLHQHPLKPVARRLLPEPLRCRLSELVNNRLLEKPSPDAEVYAGLKRGYKAEVLALQGLIGRDLSAWLWEGR